MLPSLHARLESFIERHEEISGLLSLNETMCNASLFRDLSKEYAELEPLVIAYKAYNKAQEDLAFTQELLKDPDEEIKVLAQIEVQTAKCELDNLEQVLQNLLLPKDPNDSRNIFLEIRAGTGGDEACLFAGNLFRMYTRFAENQKWQVEIMSEHLSEQGGFKEVIARISGHNVYSKLKFESGVHRVQRVPSTESQGRIHTSACTVAVLVEAQEVDAIVIDPSQLRIDTYRASGAGGQHVNKTDSAVRITHLPTGTVVECQDERSQHKNKARAMSVLQARLLSASQEKQRAELADTRKSLVGSGDRSERIRTYNYPQGRLTDHRINLTLYKLLEIMEGDLLPVVEPLSREHQADTLAHLND